MTSPLSRMETRLLRVLESSQGKVVKHRDLIELGLGFEYEQDDVCARHLLSVTVHRLRRKLPSGMRIETYRPFGYRLLKSV